MTIDTNSSAAFQRYLADHVETATPVQRLLMLFDHLLQDLEGARAGFAENHLETICSRLIHAQEILLALRDPLDTTSSLGRSLASLYTYCHDRLVVANLRKDLEVLDEVQPLLERIATANRLGAAAMNNPAVALSV